MTESERPEHPKGDHCEHGHGDRGADRQAGLQTEIGVGRAEDHSQDDACEDRLDRELRQRLAGRQGDVFLSLFNGVRSGRQLPAAHVHLLW